MNPKQIILINKNGDEVYYDETIGKLVKVDKNENKKYFLFICIYTIFMLFYIGNNYITLKRDGFIDIFKITNSFEEINIFNNSN
jgi:hypothetical protein